MRLLLNNLIGTSFLLLLLACEPTSKQEVARPARPAGEKDVAPEGAELFEKAAVNVEGSDSPKKPPPRKGPTPTPEPKVLETLEADFRGANKPSGVLFLDNKHIVHSWDEAGEEKRVAVTTQYPPGERQCKALRSAGAQDFLVCLYWYTGPGGGRVDGILFDLKREIAGEFFSAAINIQLPSTLCFPEVGTGPMPAYWVGEWSIRAPAEGKPPAIVVPVTRKGWATAEAEKLRDSPRGKTFCTCFAEDEENCQVKIEPPEKNETLVFELANDQLHPTDSTVAVLEDIAKQWGHSVGLMEWNMKMRGF